MMETLVKDKVHVLDHEKFDVYHIAIELVILSDEIIEHIPRGRGYLTRLCTFFRRIFRDGLCSVK